VLDKGRFFGELALMTEAPRNATCIAKTEVEIYPLTKDDSVARLRRVRASGSNGR
jgi:CRP-like cAMP-binding protein